MSCKMPRNLAGERSNPLPSTIQESAVIGAQATPSVMTGSLGPDDREGHRDGEEAPNLDTPARRDRALRGVSCRNRAATPRAGAGSNVEATREEALASPHSAETNKGREFASRPVVCARSARRQWRTGGGGVGY